MKGVHDAKNTSTLCAVELVRAGRSPEELTRKFEPSARAIRNWVAQADRDEGRRSDGVALDWLGLEKLRA